MMDLAPSLAVGEKQLIKLSVKGTMIIPKPHHLFIFSLIFNNLLIRKWRTAPTIPNTEITFDRNDLISSVPYWWDSSTLSHFRIGTSMGTEINVGVSVEKFIQLIIKNPKQNKHTSNNAS